MEFPFIFSLVLWLSIPLLVITRKHKLLFIIALCSFYTDFFFVELAGFKFKGVTWVAIIYMLTQKDVFLFNPRSFFNIPMYLELLLMFLVGYYFVFFDPWYDSLAHIRKPTQRLPLRTTVQIIRFLEYILQYSYFFFIFYKKYITQKYFFNTVYYLILTSIVIGGLDVYVLGGVIRKFFMPDHYALERFTGLTGEPRGIGQYCTLSIFTFLTIGLPDASKKIRRQALLGIILSFVGIGMSFSSTAIGFTFICLFIFFLLGQLHLKYLIGGVIMGLIGFLILKNNEHFMTHQRDRLAVVALENSRTEVHNVPKFFNAFEIFDKTALTFLYFNPRYTIVGVGPNTVNIPATQYLSAGDKADYKSIDSVPSNAIVNILARSGLVGILIYTLSILLMLYRLRKLEDKRLFKLLLLFVIYYIFYFNYYFYAIAGIVYGIYKASIREKSMLEIQKMNYTINSN